MTLLNSVIVEGSVSTDVNGDLFLLETKRLTTIEVESAIIPCVLRGYMRNFAENIKKGDKVRIVGRLATENNNLVLVVEHIEFKKIKEGKYTFKKD